MDSNKIRGKRVENGYTQQRSADEINVTLPTYRAKESGKTPFTSVEISKLQKAWKLNNDETVELFI